MLTASRLKCRCSRYICSSQRRSTSTLPWSSRLEVPEFHDLIGPNERRGLSPLFWSNINPYGRFRLDMDRRLDLSPAGTPAAATVESVLWSQGVRKTIPT